jgi:hypothetical protein
MYFSKAIIVTFIAASSVLGAPLEHRPSTTFCDHAKTPEPCVDGCETMTRTWNSPTTSFKPPKPTPDPCVGDCESTTLVPSSCTTTTMTTTTTTTTMSCTTHTPKSTPCCEHSGKAGCNCGDSHRSGEKCEHSCGIKYNCGNSRGPKEKCKESCDAECKCKHPCETKEKCKNCGAAKGNCNSCCTQESGRANLCDKPYFQPKATWKHNVANGTISHAATGLISKSITKASADITALLTFKYPRSARGKYCQLAFYRDYATQASGSRKIDVFTTKGIVSGPRSGWRPGNGRRTNLGRLNVCPTCSTWEDKYEVYLTEPTRCKSPGTEEGFELVGVRDEDFISWDTTSEAGPRIIMTEKASDLSS